MRKNELSVGVSALWDLVRKIYKRVVACEKALAELEKLLDGVTSCDGCGTLTNRGKFCIHCQIE